MPRDAFVIDLRLVAQRRSLVRLAVAQAAVVERHVQRQEADEAFARRRRRRRRVQKGRERADDLRPGTFKSGHPKRGGRKRGTPNALFADYKRAIVEAAYRIGYDGNRKDGIVGYFRWIASRHPEVFGGVLLTNILALEFAEDSLSERIYPKIGRAHV